VIVIVIVTVIDRAVRGERRGALPDEPSERR
jgi:hypothetical protein